MDQLGVSVHLRDVATLDDLADVTAPGPIEVGDLVGDAEGVYLIEDVLVGPDTRGPVVPALARRIEPDPPSP